MVCLKTAEKNMMGTHTRNAGYMSNTNPALANIAPKIQKQFAVGANLFAAGLSAHYLIQ